MTAERVVLLALSVLLAVVFFEQDAELARLVALGALAVAAVSGLRAGLRSPGWVWLSMTSTAIAWLVLTAWHSPAGPDWGAVGWPAVGLMLPLLVLRVAVAMPGATVLTMAPVVASTIVLMHAVAWASGPDSNARLVVYLPAIQWSGYPELGLLACMATGALLGLAVGERRLGVRLCAGALAVVFAAATVPLASRGAQVTVLALPLVLGATMRVRHWTRWRVASAAVLTIVLAIAVLALTSVGERVGEDLFGTQAAQAVGLREQSWRHAVRAIGERPWMGTGPGQFVGAVAGEHAHNFWLHLGAETGLLGAVLMTCIWGRAVFLALPASSATAHRGLSLAAHSALVAFLLRSLTDHFLAAQTTSSWRMWILQGCWLGLAEASRARDLSAPPAERP